ncbi:MAG: hypothetical protein ACRC2T_08090 [Thermoguttaceae bacterium]
MRQYFYTSFTSTIIVFCLLTVMAHTAEENKTPPPAANNEQYDLSSKRAVGSTDLVEILLEVAGEIQQASVGSDKQLSDKMSVTAGFRYEEQLLASKADAEKPSLKSVRNYSLACARMSIGDVQRTPNLDKQHNLVVCEIANNATRLFSAQGTLKSEQLLLIEGLPGNTLSIDMLLPNKKVKVGDTWKIPESALLSYLNVDAITQQTLEATLTSVADDLAMVEIVGDVQGVYLGAQTEMTLIQAGYQFDIRSGRINWIGMIIGEKRSIGDVGPGLDVKAKLQVKISPLEKAETLTPEYLADFDLSAKDTNLRLRYENGKAPWKFTHPRSWYIILDELDKTFLRLLDKGELVAQCTMQYFGKLSSLSNAPTLDKFAEDLKNEFGTSFGKMVSKDEALNAAGYTEYRVIIDGNVASEDKTQNIPLRWVYYLITDKEGNQVVIVFTIHADMLERFGDNEEVILDSFRISETL